MNLFWDPNPDLAEQYSFALGADTHVMANGPAVARALHDNVEITEVVIGPDVDLDEACDLAESTRLERPELGVILVRHRLDVTTLAQALRKGVREVVSATDQTALSDAVRRSRALTARLAGNHQGHRAGTSEGRVITVFSAKGGVGKTFVSTNLGAHLAKQGHRTLLIDLDLSFGDVAISLQLLPGKSVMDVVAMGGHLDEQGLHSLVTTHEPSGLDVICAPPDPGDADRIPAAAVLELLRVARAHYEFVLIDTPPAFSEHVLAASDLSNALVLITTLDIPAVKNLRLAIETLDVLGSPKDARIVVLNRSDAKVGLNADDVSAALKQPIAVGVPNSLAVPASVNRGVPIILDDPSHPVSAALRELGDKQLRERFGYPVEPVRQRRGFALRGRK